MISRRSRTFARAGSPPDRNAGHRSRGYRFKHPVELRLSQRPAQRRSRVLLRSLEVRRSGPLLNLHTLLDVPQLPELNGEVGQRLKLAVLIVAALAGDGRGRPQPCPVLRRNRRDPPLMPARVEPRRSDPPAVGQEVVDIVPGALAWRHRGRSVDGGCGPVGTG
jgi:hypothetical protein